MIKTEKQHDGVINRLSGCGSAVAAQRLRPNGCGCGSGTKLHM
ncbi:MAG: hypothetical protein PHE01_06520 [Methanosarcina sp.]|nr:hypothetical protein [Methanosarcina sp.]